jgi:LysR family transcriptional activator of nhaA
MPFSGKALRLHVGISDGIAKMAVHRLLAPILKDDHLHLICHDGEFDDLIADLAAHRLDLVLADHAPTSSFNFQGFSTKSWPAVLFRGTQLNIGRRSSRYRISPTAWHILPVLLPTIAQRLAQSYQSTGLKANAYESQRGGRI